MFCTDCGKQIGDEARFCTHCGRPTAKAGGAQAAVPPPPVPQQPPPPRQRQFVEANYEVPHCKFTKTPEGFRCSFKAPSLKSHQVIDGSGNVARAQGGIGGALVCCI